MPKLEQHALRHHWGKSHARGVWSSLCWSTSNSRTHGARWTKKTKYLLWDRLRQPPVQIEFPHLSAPSQVFHKQKLHCRQLYKSSLFARWAFDIGKKLSEPQGGDSVQAKNPPANASSAMKCSCLPQYFVQNLDNDVHVLMFKYHSSVPSDFLMPKGTNNWGFGIGRTGAL